MCMTHTCFLNTACVDVYDAHIFLNTHYVDMYDTNVFRQYSLRRWWRRRCRSIWRIRDWNGGGRHVDTCPGVSLEKQKPFEFGHAETLMQSRNAARLAKKNNGNLREKTKSTTDLSNIARSCSPFVCIWRRGDNGQLDLRALASGPGHMSVRGRILAAKHGQESLRDLNRFCSNLLMTITTNLCMLRDWYIVKLSISFKEHYIAGAAQLQAGGPHIWDWPRDALEGDSSGESERHGRGMSLKSRLSNDAAATPAGQGKYKTLTPNALARLGFLWCAGDIEKQWKQNSESKNNFAS